MNFMTPLGATLLSAATALMPAAAASDTLKPLCPDRPGKITSPCTLDPGHYQIEIDGFDTQSQNGGGVSVRTTVIGNPTLKYGLTGTVDIEASLAPYIEQRAGGTSISGQGDLFLRGKWNFLDEDGPLAAVVEPFVKLGTASRGLGNGAWEGGMVLPLALDLGGGWSLASTPEADVLLDESGTGRHLAAIDVAGINRALNGGVTLGAEIWTAQNFDPRGTGAQYSFDLDGAWQPVFSANLQLDAGINFGLNRAAAHAQFYVGLSERI